MEASRGHGQNVGGSAPEPSRFLESRSEMLCVQGSDLEPLVEFLTSRVARLHHCCLHATKKATADTSSGAGVHQPSRTASEIGETQGMKRPAGNWRTLVAIGGIPGSGKSTIAARLQAALNARAKSHFCECLLKKPRTQQPLSPHSHPTDAAGSFRDPEPVGLVGLDGFHYTRAELDQWASNCVPVRGI